ncbi:MAG: 5-formyltetrahydrofolate cyclo-ligase [Clostridiales bacterium]|nr:5-formyltetrahydrofolate cyclo-ligase [Clostridiales bacterium]
MKNELRTKYKELRKNVENKEEKDYIINCAVLNSDLYAKAEQILCYASLPNEICTDFIIRTALKHDKKIALPRCSDFNGNMDFYYISSFDDIKSGTFGIKEPDKNACKRVYDFNNSLCVVPALCFDSYGVRLGYGKGYYDRFLKKFTSVSAGLCYNDFIAENLPQNEFDIPVDYIITETEIINCKGG